MGFPLLYNNNKEEEALPHPASPRARELTMAAMDFQEMIQTCRSIKTGYSRPFQGLPNTINLSRDGRQVLFLSRGSLYSHSLPYHGDGEARG